MHVKFRKMSMDDKSEVPAMLARSFSTEFGKTCVWVEDIYKG